MWRRSMEWGSGFESFRFSPRNVPPSFPHLFWKVPGTANDQCLETRMKPGFLHLFWPGASFLERKHRGCTPSNSRSSPRWWSRLFLPAFLLCASFAPAKLGRVSCALRNLLVRTNNFLRIRARARLGIQVFPKNPGAPFSGGIFLSLRVILAPARLTRPRTAWEFAKLPFCSTKPRFLRLTPFKN